MADELGSISDPVWEREGKGEGTLSRGAYTTAVTIFTIYGLFLTMIVAAYTLNWHPGIWAVLGIGLAMPIVGIFIALGSDSWPISLFGYTLVVAGLAAITGPAVALYEMSSVIMAIAATLGVTIVMSIVGILYPKSLEGWGGYLFGALLALVFVRFGQAIMASMGVAESIWYIPIIEYGAAVLFSLYIVYDWNRALRLPHTLDNAVDCALAIYLDIINLFVTLLRIFGKKK